ncbi:hypothetical protein D3C87_2161960 [compost metagenome]
MASVSDPGGDAGLRAAALEALHAAAPFPPIPPALDRPLTFDIPIAFNLEEP